MGWLEFLHLTFTEFLFEPILEATFAFQPASLPVSVPSLSHLKNVNSSSAIVETEGQRWYTEQSLGWAQRKAQSVLLSRRRLDLLFEPFILRASGWCWQKTAG